MTSNTEKIDSTSEKASATQAKHVLDGMPSFEDHMHQMKSQETNSSAAEHLDQSDKTIDKILNKLGHGIGEGYFENPDRLISLTKDTIAQTPQQSVDNFKAQIENYKARSTKNYQIRAATFYEQTKKNIQNLAAQNLVGSDTIKVFLNPDLISSTGKTRIMSNYNEIQSDYSRREETSWMDGRQTYDRYVMRAKIVADSLFKNIGDVNYQKEIPGIDNKYNTNKQITRGDFIHVNSNQPHEKGGLRCYISADKTTDPSAVLYAWNESFQASPLKNNLYFKFATSMNDHRDGGKQRPDDIIIYKTDDIDDTQFKELLQDFQKRCNDMSPDLLPSDDAKMPAAAQKIANGISIAGEPDYVNDYLRYTDRKVGKHSWTTFIDNMAILSTSVAANRLGIKPNSIDAPGLQDETKKVFREFMLLSRINPDTMLPIEYGEQKPSWANLKNSIEHNAKENNNQEYKV